MLNIQRICVFLEEYILTEGPRGHEELIWQRKLGWAMKWNYCRTFSSSSMGEWNTAHSVTFMEKAPSPTHDILTHSINQLCRYTEFFYLF